jgi:transposase
MTVMEHETLEELVARRDAARGDLREWRRLQAVALARQGKSAAAIGTALGVSDRSVQRWVEAYNDGAGLADRPRSGRPCRLDAAQRQAIAERLDDMALGKDAPPEARPPVGNTWRGDSLRALAKREFGVAYSPSGLYDLLRRMGYVRLMPRPQHPKADPAAQEAFKKRRAASSPTCGAAKPAGAGTAGSCGSGSPTKRGSARKER